MKFPFVRAAVSLLIVLGIGAALWFTPPCATGCNVILIMVDTLSAEHIATHGYTRDTMPETTAFFEKGVIFDTASSNATWTLASFTSMYFSDVATNITYKDLEERVRPTLQSELRSHAVAIRAVTPPGENFIFDTITRLYDRNEIIPTITPAKSIELGEEQLGSLSEADTPFFLLIHTFEVHDPYAPNAPFDEFFEESSAYPKVSMGDILKVNSGALPMDPVRTDTFRLRYDQQIAEADHHIAAFLNRIPKSVLAHTVIILAADHGEAFGEHGVLWHGNDDLYEEQLHIPLMMRVPGVSSRRIAEPVSLLDMAPTVLSFLRAPVPDTFTGKSLVPLLRGGTLGTRIIPSVSGLTFYLEEPVLPVPKTLAEAGALGTDRSVIVPTVFGVRSSMEKLFVTYPGPEEVLHWYDLTADPLEKSNLMEVSERSAPTLLTQALAELQAQAATP